MEEAKLRETGALRAEMFTTSSFKTSPLKVLINEARITNHGFFNSPLCFFRLLTSLLSHKNRLINIDFENNC